MDIGGLDIDFDTDYSFEQVLKKIQDIFKQHWPLAVYEFDESPGEFFVYRDQAAFEAWSDDIPDGFENTMFYFIVRGREFSLVIDSIDSETKPIVDAIVSDLKVV